MNIFRMEHGAYRQKREMDKFVSRNFSLRINAELTPRKKFKHISYRTRGKYMRAINLHFSIRTIKVFLDSLKGGDK